MLNEKKYWESLDDYFNHTRSLVNLLDLRKSLLSADKKKKFLTTLDEIKNLIEEQIDFNENGNMFYKLTKTTKHAKRHFWLTDVCTCHGLLPSHSA